MIRHCLFGFVLYSLLCQPSFADDPVFSGPQIGEKLPSFQAKGVLGDLAGKEFDFIKQAQGKPVVLIFFHARTRPAFGLTNTIMKYAATRSKDGLQCGVFFLTDDPTSTETWVKRVEKHLTRKIVHGISLDGGEGPGSYGLNRNVTLTILVGNQGKVTANFALVQPSLPADGPKILQAIVDVTGGGKVPSIADLQNRQRQAMMRKDQPAEVNDPMLTTLLRALINKQASVEQVEKAAADIEDYIAKNPAAAKQLLRISTTVVNSGKLSNYGTESAQKTLTMWAKKKTPKAEKPTD